MSDAHRPAESAAAWVTAAITGLLTGAALGLLMGALGCCLLPLDLPIPSPYQTLNRILILSCVGGSVIGFVVGGSGQFARSFLSRPVQYAVTFAWVVAAAGAMGARIYFDQATWRYSEWGMLRRFILPWGGAGFLAGAGLGYGAGMLRDRRGNRNRQQVPTASN